jgi:hypothetical protein
MFISGFMSRLNQLPKFLTLHKLLDLINLTLKKYFANLKIFGFTFYLHFIDTCFEETKNVQSCFAGSYCYARMFDFRKGLPNETQCYSLVNLTPSGLFRILHIE